MKPIIGITSRRAPRGPEDGITPLGNNIHFSVIGHCLAVERCDGLPVVVPVTEDLDAVGDYLRLCDGLVITEGNDLDPTLYGQQPLPECSKNLDPVKDRFEFELLRQALDADVPVLGICRGLHVVNALRGGTLHQDLPTYFTGRAEDGPVRHRGDGDARYRTYHDVTLAEGSVLRGCYGSARYSVNTIHHQGVAKLGDGLVPTAHTDDGLIEAVELPDRRFAVFLQWHPERIWDAEPTHLAVFRAFLEAAGKFRSDRVAVV
jgi:putative glutamine amidotransferase